jgi:uncharacterized protein
MNLGASARQARSLERLEHRPWPLPPRPWVLGQTWEDLLFAHWRVPLADVQAHVPRVLEVDQHDGSAWLAIAPFRLSSLRLRGMLPLPLVSSFFEVNVRTYVRAADGKPGIWFFSLDASSMLAVAAARRLYDLPYLPARIRTARRGDWIDVECARLGERGRVFCARYRPRGRAFHAEPGSLEWFLTERYCLYTTNAHGALLRAEIHHRPWELQRAEAEISLTTISPLELQGDPLCHFSRRQDAVLWTPEPAL